MSYRSRCMALNPPVARSPRSSSLPRQPAARRWGRTSAMRIRPITPALAEFGRSIQTGDVDALRAALEEDPSLAVAYFGDDDQARTALHMITDFPGHVAGNVTMIGLLVAAGADVDARFIGAHSETPLHWAASCDDVDAIEALLDAGADIEARRRRADRRAAARRRGDLRAVARRPHARGARRERRPLPRRSARHGRRRHPAARRRTAAAGDRQRAVARVQHRRGDDRVAAARRRRRPGMGRLQRRDAGRCRPSIRQRRPDRAARSGS